jgi:hypothetical protein
MAADYRTSASTRDSRLMMPRHEHDRDPTTTAARGIAKMTAADRRSSWPHFEAAHRERPNFGLRERRHP